MAMWSPPMSPSITSTLAYLKAPMKTSIKLHKQDTELFYALHLSIMYTSQINKIMEPIKHPYVLPKKEPGKKSMWAHYLSLLIFIIHSYLHHCTLIQCKHVIGFITQVTEYKYSILILRHDHDLLYNGV